MDELKIISKTSIDKLETELNDLNLKKLMESEKTNMETIKKKTLVTDEKVLNLFEKLSKQYSDIEWLGRNIYLRNLDIVIKPPYTQESVFGSENS